MINKISSLGGGNMAPKNNYPIILTSGRKIKLQLSNNHNIFSVHNSEN